MVAHMRALAGDRSSEAAQHVVKDLRRGLPPAALVALLESLRANPRSDLAGIALELFAHRRPAVRSHACQVLIAQGEPWARGAILMALEDVDARVRGVAYDAIIETPRSDFQWVLYKLIQRNEDRAVDAFVLSSTQDVLPHLEKKGALPASSLARIYGGLLRRTGFVNELHRLAMVSELAKIESPNSHNELWIFANRELDPLEPGPQLLARQFVGYVP